MRYNEYNAGNYIIAVGTGDGGIEISEERYKSIIKMVKTAPIAPTGYTYMLRTDLTWELVELPPDSVTITAT